ncbi:MAG: hypothetical protein K6A05_01990 [Lachnospiraceae bacterium]|nr:hypothetical protein [Lachnospiraceae bacterium]
MAVELNVNAVVNNYATSSTPVTKTKTEEEAPKTAEEGVVYDKTKETDSSKAPYSINKMSEEDRANLVQQLKADQENRMSQLFDIVRKSLEGQGKTFAIATGDDSVWKLFANGEVTVDEAARKQAQEDISEDGYWGVKQTSQRLFDFASALAGDDVEKMKNMQSAMEKGFKEATKAWGRDLPEISQKTLDAANKLFEDYYKSKESSGVTA